MTVKPQSILIPVCLTVALLLLCGAPSFGQDAVMKNGKTAQLTIFEPVQAGSVTLEPGTYTVQHRVEDGDHVMRFRPAGGKKPDQNVPVVCDLDPTQQKWTRTEARYKNEGGTRTLARIMIQGEKVTYLFD